MAAPRQNREQGVTSKWEWVAAAISAVLVIGLLAVLIRSSARAATGPDVRLRVDSISRVTDGWLAHFTAHNRGTRTAAGVTIEGTLPRPDGGAETSTATLDYLPGRGASAGGLFFRQQPVIGQLQLRAGGYRRP